MTTLEVLAIARLRQWFNERSAQQRAKTRNPAAHGWQRRDERSFDARQVRCLDTERALESISPDRQVMLIYRYVYKEPDAKTAAALGCSERKIGYVIPQARYALAHAMDRLNLL
jgi:DNA-directed RNA polymerase specialized sigma24 family protein